MQSKGCATELQWHCRLRHGYAQLPAADLDAYDTFCADDSWGLYQGQAQ